MYFYLQGRGAMLRKRARPYIQHTNHIFFFNMQIPFGLWSIIHEIFHKDTLVCLLDHWPWAYFPFLLDFELFVGLADGETEGLALGLAVGETEGLAVGLTDGACVST